MADKYRCYDTDNDEPEDALEINSKPLLVCGANLLERMRHVWAFDAEDAAKMFAKKNDVDQGEYGYANHGGRVTVISTDGTEQVFDIDSWAEPQYSASPAKDADEN